LDEAAEANFYAMEYRRHRAFIARVPSFAVVHRYPDNAADLLLQSVDVRSEPPALFSGR
jgi:hypothetical protein